MVVLLVYHACPGHSVRAGHTHASAKQCLKGVEPHHASESIGKMPDFDHVLRPLTGSARVYIAFLFPGLVYIYISQARNLQAGLQARHQSCRMQAQRTHAYQSVMLAAPHLCCLCYLPFHICIEASSFGARNLRQGL